MQIFSGRIKYLLFFSLLLFPACFVYRDIKIIQRDVKNIDSRLQKAEGSPEEIRALFLTVKEELKKIDQQIVAIKEIPLLINNLADIRLNLEELRESLKAINGKIEEYNHNIGNIAKQIKQLDEGQTQLSALVKLKKEEEAALEGVEKRIALFNEKLSLLPDEYKSALAEESKKNADITNVLNHRVNALELKINELFNLFKAKIIDDIERKKSVPPEKKEPEQKPEEKTEKEKSEKVKPEKEKPREMKKPSSEIPSAEMNSAELYLTAYNFYSGGNYELALEGFKNYIEKYPQTDLTDNAHYWIGEIYFRQGDYRRAKETLGKMISDYAQSDKIPAALLKLGLSQYQLNEKKEAVNHFKKLIEKYPQTDEAKEAGERLSGIEKEGIK